MSMPKVRKFLLKDKSLSMPLGMLTYEIDTASWLIRLNDAIAPRYLPMSLVGMYTAQQDGRNLTLAQQHAAALSWVQSRVMPPERPEMRAWLNAHELHKYSLIDVLMAEQGRCVLDNIYLEETV